MQIYPFNGLFLIQHTACKAEYGNKDAERLSKLANLQSTILQHAFKFPGLKKLVYSTCSVNVEENENVVNDVMKHIGNQNFKLMEAMPSWKHRRGLQGQEMCLRVDQNIDLCTGFFVAVFQRC